MRIKVTGHAVCGVALVILLCAPVWGGDSCPVGTGRECQPTMDACANADLTSATVQLGGEGSIGTENECGSSPAKDADGNIVEADLTYSWNRELDATKGTLQVVATNMTCDPSISKITTIWINTPTEIANCVMRSAVLTNPGLAPRNVCGDSSCDAPASGKVWTFDTDTRGEGCLGEFDWEFDTNGVQMGVLPGGQLAFELDCTGAGGLDTLTACDVATAGSAGEIGERTAQTAMHFQNTDPQEGELSNKVSSNCQEDLYVDLADFSATPDDGLVELEWRTSVEVDNAGFKVLRREVASGAAELLTAGMIPAAGGIFGGASYSFVDETATNGVEYQYSLVDVELSGAESEHPGRTSVANPRRPAIRLKAPRYGTSAMRLGDAARFEWESQAAGDARLMVSSDPTFEDVERTLEIRLRQRSTNGRVDFNLRQQRAMEGIALDNNGLLYWKVLQSNSRDRTVESSGTFSLSYGVLDSETPGKSQRGVGRGSSRTTRGGR